MRLVLLGPPGSGKGTQGAALAEHFGVPHVSSGELLRAEVAAGTDVGHEVARYLDRGDLVPDDMVIGVVGRALAVRTAKAGYILDGFPRTASQAARLEALAGPDEAPDAVVVLELADDVARERLVRRSKEGRSDDTDAAAVERRLHAYHVESEPLLTYYGKRGLLVRVDADRSPEAVTAATVGALAIASRGSTAHPPEGTGA